MPWSQIIASVVDKVLLGGVALVVAHFLNRRIEEFRARRALESEFLRERTRRLDEIYVLMLEIETTADRFSSLAMDYIREKRSKPLLLVRPAELDPAHKKFRELSAELRRKAAHSRPWIGDDLGQLCAEYERVVKESVSEQTIPGTHDTEKIERLEGRTAELQRTIVAAIREGGHRAVPAAPPLEAIAGGDHSERPALPPVEARPQRRA